MARKQKPLTPARRTATAATRAVRTGCAALAFAALASRSGAAVAAADPRPTDEDIFGASTPAGTGGAAPSPSGAPSGVGGAAGASGTSGAASGAPSAGPPAPPAGAGTPGVDVTSPAGASPEPSRDEALLGDPNAGPRLSAETAPDDPLRIGGQIYLRSLAQATEGQPVQNIRVSAPSLVDAYFDARPNDRVRGFVLGRVFFDPTLPTTPATTSLTGMPGASVASTLAVPLLSGVQAARGPSTLLDQLWLRFDILHTVFITAGRQHVKWGTGRFWTPTDFLHPQARNPIAAFDARPGFTMLKAHVPWESRGWNFYGFALVEGTPQIDSTGRTVAGSDGAGTLGQIGTAGRAELVLGPAELGLDAVVYRGHKPKLGADLSFGIGDLDLYVDSALRYSSEVPRVGFNPAFVPFAYDFTMPYDSAAFSTALTNWINEKYPAYQVVGVKPQVTVGGTYSLKYNDNDVFTLTGEYFYNALGYDDPRVYPGLLGRGSFPFFYTGRHYAALSAIAAAPYSWNYTTFTLSTLGNLSDRSFITRLDYALVLLTHLTFEAFGAINYGRSEGEFRLGATGVTFPTTTGFGPLDVGPQSFSFGVGLRVKI